MRTSALLGAGDACAHEVVRIYDIDPQGVLRHWHAWGGITRRAGWFYIGVQPVSDVRPA